MRITGGAWAGRSVRVPKGDEVRPTADRVRESLFARLGDLDGLRVLDLFAGSGSLGIEALSRGAVRCVFVERSARVASTLEANLAALDAGERARVLRRPVDAVLRSGLRDETPFDLVLLDPPYAGGWVEPTLAALASSGVLDPKGLVVVETDRRHPPADALPWRVTDARSYGDTLITQLRPGAERPEVRPHDD